MNFVIFLVFFAFFFFVAVFAEIHSPIIWRPTNYLPVAELVDLDLTIRILNPCENLASHFEKANQAKLVLKECTKKWMVETMSLGELCSNSTDLEIKKRFKKQILLGVGLAIGALATLGGGSLITSLYQGSMRGSMTEELNSMSLKVDELKKHVFLNQQTIEKVKTKLNDKEYSSAFDFHKEGNLYNLFFWRFSEGQVSKLNQVFPGILPKICDETKSCNTSVWSATKCEVEDFEKRVFRLSITIPVPIADTRIVEADPFEFYSKAENGSWCMWAYIGLRYALVWNSDKCFQVMGPHSFVLNSYWLQNDVLLSACPSDQHAEYSSRWSKMLCSNDRHYHLQLKEVPDGYLLYCHGSSYRIENGDTKACPNEIMKIDKSTRLYVDGKIVIYKRHIHQDLSTSRDTSTFIINNVLKSETDEYPSVESLITQSESSPPSSTLFYVSITLLLLSVLFLLLLIVFIYRSSKK